MMTSSIPDFLPARDNEADTPKNETAPEPNVEKITEFMPSLGEHETAEFFTASENSDTSGKTQSQEMSAETEFPTNEETSEKSKEALKRRLPKGSKAPVLSLLDAVGVITNIYELAGGNVSLDALSQIVRNSRSSSTFSKKLTALRNFGLVEIENQDVRLSELGNRIVAPKSPAAQISAIKEAFISVEVFAQIYKQLCGKILPQDEFLVNFFTDYVPKDLAAIWMEKFKDSATYARVLMDRGDGKFQVIEDVAVNQPIIPPNTKENNADEKPEGEIDETKNDETKPKSNEVKPHISSSGEGQPPIKEIKLKSGISVWIGTDANVLQLKKGEERKFIFRLIDLFDEFEEKGAIDDSKSENKDSE